MNEIIQYDALIEALFVAPIFKKTIDDDLPRQARDQREGKSTNGHVRHRSIWQVAPGVL